MKIGIVGAGVMGAGIAQTIVPLCSQIVLIDKNTVQLTKAKQIIRDEMRMQKLLGKQSASQKSVASILYTTSYNDLKDAEFIIENVTESFDTKKVVYHEIEKHCSSSCILIANTSVISITKLGAELQDPTRFIGVHFMNPVSLKNTAELICGIHTSKATRTQTCRLLDLMGKQYVEAADSPGFISNRVLMPMINEAVFLLQESVASAEDIDTVFKQCFGHAMGPLETADLIGLDTVLFSILELYQSLNDGKYRPCTLLKRMVDAGLLGRKSGRGFYTYTIE